MIMPIAIINSPVMNKMKRVSCILFFVTLSILITADEILRQGQTKEKHPIETI